MNAELISAVAGVMEANARLLRVLGAEQIVNHQGPVHTPASDPRFHDDDWWGQEVEQGTANDDYAPLDAPVTEDKAVEIADTIAPVIARMKDKEAVAGFRTMGNVTVGEFTFKTTGRFVNILNALIDGPKTADELIAGSHGTTEGSIRANIYKTNTILRDATQGQWIIRSIEGKHLGAFGKTPGKWKLVRKADEAPEPKPESIKSVAVVPVVEVAEAAPELPPAPQIYPPAPVVPATHVVAPEPVKAAPAMPGGHICAVDMDNGIIVTKSGAYSMNGRAILGRTMRKMSCGSLFGLDVISRVGGTPAPPQAGPFLLNYNHIIKNYGLEFWTDGHNARLREIGA